MSISWKLCELVLIFNGFYKTVILIIIIGITIKCISVSNQNNMKKIRQISQHPICILTVTISLLFASCSKNNVAEDQIESALND